MYMRLAVSPLACSSASLRLRAMALVVMPIAGLPGRVCSLDVSSAMSGRSVGSPPVSLILFTPAVTKVPAWTARQHSGLTEVCMVIWSDARKCAMLVLEGMQNKQAASFFGCSRTVS